MVGKPVEALTSGQEESPPLRGGYDEPAADTERILAEVLADVVRVEQVPVDSHFFDDLGADSLVMAQFCARVRKRADLPSVSMKDVYRHPTISSLAAALADAAPAPAEPRRPRQPAEAARRRPARARVRPVRSAAAPDLPRILLPRRARRRSRATSGSPPAPGWSTSTCGRSCSAARRSSACARFRSWPSGCSSAGGSPSEIRIWSLAYVRFWIVKTLIRVNPMRPVRRLAAVRAVSAGAGRRIGQGRRDPLPHVPVCTDLLTIGAGTVIRKESFFLCYRAHAGRIQTGPVTLGRDVFVGEKTVLDIDTSMGDGAQLGHASALHSGQAVPAGERWHGSPAQRTEVDYRTGRAGRLRHAAPGRLRAVPPLLQRALRVRAAGRRRRVPAGRRGPVARRRCWTRTRWRSRLGAVLPRRAGPLPRALLRRRARRPRWSCSPSPALLNLVIKPDKVYPLYGFHYSVAPGDRAHDQHQVLHAAVR